MWGLLVIIPWIKFGLVNIQAFSDFGAHKVYGRIFNFGLLLIMVLQVVFVWYVVGTLQIPFVIFWVFFAGSLSGLLASIITEQLFMKVHLYLGICYFVLTSIGAFLIPFYKYSISHLFQIKQDAKNPEIYMFLFSTVWVLGIYLLLPGYI